MKRFLLSLVLLIMSTVVLENTVWSQKYDPKDIVKYDYSIEQNGDEATVIVSIDIKKDWRVFAAHLPEGSFFFPLNIELAQSPNYVITGDVIEPKPTIVYDDLMDENVHYQLGSIVIKQKLKIKSEKSFTLNGTFEFQACTTELCLPPSWEEFVLEVEGVKSDE